MAYITQADLETRYGVDEIVKLSDRNRDSIADADVINAAIIDAEAVIDSYLAGGYDLPLNPTPSIIIRLACSIARYHLYDDNPAEKVKEEYDAAKLALEKISSGELKLPPCGSEAASPNYSPGGGQFNNISGY